LWLTRLRGAGSQTLRISSFFSNDLKVQMTTLAQALSRLTRTDVDVESLEAISIFCGIGLLLSLLAINAYGLDLSVAFF